MALHGDISINGRPLWTWEAVRQSRVPRTENTYRVYLYAANGEQVAETTLSHVYAEGAIELTRKVIGWAATLPADGLAATSLTGDPA